MNTATLPPAGSPAPTPPSPEQQLGMVLQRLAAAQGASLDVQGLQRALTTVPQQATPFKTLAAICLAAGLPRPTRLRKPDRARLPLLYDGGAEGWCLVMDRNPQGLWVVLGPDGSRTVQPNALRGKVVELRLVPRVRMGLGLGMSRGTGPDQSFSGRLRQTLGAYRADVVEACLASALIGVLALATSLFSMQVYDRVIPTRNEYTLVTLSAGVLLSILVEMMLKFARSHVMDHVVVGMDVRLSRDIFERFLQLRADQVPASVGSLASQLRGYEQVRGFYTASTLFTLIDLPLAVLFLAVIMVVASPWVALIPLVFGLLALAVGLSIRTRIMDAAREGAALSNMKTGLLVEAVEGMETIKAGSGGWKFLSRWIGVNQTTIQSDLKTRSASESVGYLSATIQQISYAGLVVVGSLVVMQGQMTMGALIASSILSGRILAPIMAIPGLLVQHAHAVAALEGLEKLYLLKSENHGIDQPLVPDRLLGHYQLSPLRFAYGDNPAALVLQKPLEIQPGERVAVLGSIGAGKSTLLRLLSGMVPPQQGQVLLDGLDLSHIDRQVINQFVGYLQQEHRLFEGTLRENLLVGMVDPGDDAILQAMKRTGMDRFVAGHAKGLDRAITEGGKGLSGGQKQLVAFTRLVLCNTPVMLLDEPTATMDDEQERRCLQVLVQEAQMGKTMVIVTHKPSILPLVTRIMVVAGNTVVLDGPRDAVLQQLQQPRAVPA